MEKNGIPIRRYRGRVIYGKTHNYLDTAGGEDAILASGVRISFVEHR